MQLKRLLILGIALAAIASSGCLTETKQNKTQETVQQNSTPFMAFGSGFYGQEDWSGIPTHWMQANATLLINSSEDRTATLSMNAQSFYRNRTLEVYAGDGLLTRTAIPSKSFVEIEAPIHLAKGINALRFRIPEGCERPIDKPELNSSDERCLSVAIQKIALDEWRSSQLKYLKGFYDIENGTHIRWIQDDATIVAYSLENRTTTLSLMAQSFYRNRTLDIYSGDDLLAHSVVSPSRFVDFATPVHLSKGANFIRFHVPEGCEKPSDKPELKNPDTRCLSLVVLNISFSDIKSEPLK